MGRRILVLNGHPDPDPGRFCAALADSFESAARASGHDVRRLNIGALDYPSIRNTADFMDGEVPASIAAAQNDIAWAQHIAFVMPLWMGGPPGRLKGFMEQTFRYGFAMDKAKGMMGGRLRGRTLHMIVTMGMPGILYRFWFGAGGVRAFDLIMRLSGIRVSRRTYAGMIERGPEHRARWLERIARYGAHG